MPRRLYLLADDQSFGPLRHAMSDPLLLDGEHSAPSKEEAAEEDLITRHDPARLIPSHGRSGDGGRSEKRDIESREELFARLLGSTVCHLVVLEELGVPGGSSGIMLQDSMALDRLKAWYDAFHTEVGQRVGYRKDEYCHLLILVCADDVPNAQLSKLNAILNPPDRDAEIHACYVMLRRLNWASRHVCHSRYVWPLSVARLLRYLWMVPEELHHRMGHPSEALTFAWRGIDLIPNLPATLLDEQWHRCLRRGRQRLLEPDADARPRWNAEAFEPAPHLPKQQLREKPSPAIDRWYTYRCVPAVDEVASPDRWELEIQESGRRFASVLGRGLLDDEPDSWKQVGRVWRQVHHEPFALQLALSQPCVGQGPDVDVELEQLGASFDSLAALTQKREVAIEEAGECARLMEEAQRGFVNPSVRIVLACAVAALISYASIMLSRFLFGGWTVVAIAVSACGMAGAVLASLIPWYLEHRAGRQAAETFRGEVLGEIDRCTIDRDWTCQQLLANGHRFWARWRAASASRRLRRLLERLQWMLQHSLRAGDAAAARPSSGDGPIEQQEAPTARDSQLLQQQQEYLEKTSIRYDTGGFNPDEAALSRLVDTHVEAFRETWRALCREHDPRAAGNMPAGVWLGHLREFRDRFRDAVHEELYRQAVAQVSERSTAEWTGELRDVLNQPYDFYLSCPVTSAQINQSARQTRLLLRPELERASLGSGLEQVTIDYCCQTNTRTGVGMLFDQVPIRLGEGEEGFIRATSDEA